MTRILKSPLEEGRKVRVGVKIKTNSGTGVVTKIMACGSQSGSGNGWIGCKQCPGYLTIKYDDGSIDNSECFGYAGSGSDTNGFKFKVLNVKDYIDKWVDVK